jgi:Cdc6-like AAA superfamily ATPase
VTGPPGQGKSVLSNFVLKHLESLDSKVIYCFCSIKTDEGSRNANSVLRALIVQLCERQRCLFQMLPPNFEKHSNLFFSASQDDLCHILKRMLEAHVYPRVYCVIDGLDVYQDE